MFEYILQDSRIKSYKVKAEQCRKDVLNKLKELAKQIQDFLVEFNNASNSWKELRRSIASRHQLLLSLLSIFLVLSLNILLNIFK